MAWLLVKLEPPKWFAFLSRIFEMTPILAPLKYRNSVNYPSNNDRFVNSLSNCCSFVWYISGSHPKNRHTPCEISLPARCISSRKVLPIWRQEWEFGYDECSTYFWPRYIYIYEIRDIIQYLIATGYDQFWVVALRGGVEGHGECDRPGFELEIKQAVNVIDQVLNFFWSPAAVIGL